MGTLGHPQSRYQNRVSCLIPLAAMMAVGYRLKAARIAGKILHHTPAQLEDQL
jgi:hypothetical protein